MPSLTPFQCDADTAARDHRRCPPPRATVRLQESWRDLQLRVGLAESLLARCEEAAVIAGTRLR